MWPDWRGLLRGLDDFIIDRIYQPAVNAVFYIFGASKFGFARGLTAAGALAGLAWVRHYYIFPHPEFYVRLFALGVLVLSSGLVIFMEELRAARRSGAVPATRLNGMGPRLYWLVLFGIELIWVAFSRDRQASLNFLWTVVVISPYWVICCAAPPARRQAKQKLVAEII